MWIRWLKSLKKDRNKGCITCKGAQSMVPYQLPNIYQLLIWVNSLLPWQLMMKATFISGFRSLTEDPCIRLVLVKMEQSQAKYMWASLILRKKEKSPGFTVRGNFMPVGSMKLVLTLATFWFTIHSPWHWKVPLKSTCLLRKTTPQWVTQLSWSSNP